MPQIMITTSPRAAFAAGAAVSSSSRATNTPHPRVLTSLFPSHGTASRNEAGSHHCRHFPPLLWDKRVPHEPPGLSPCPEHGGSAPQPAQRDRQSLFPQHLL